jgi:hypothetical protein
LCIPKALQLNNLILFSKLFEDFMQYIMKYKWFVM